MPAHHLTTPPALTAPSPMLLPYITRELCFKALQTYRIQKKNNYKLDRELPDPILHGNCVSVLITELKN